MIKEIKYYNNNHQMLYLNWKNKDFKNKKKKKRIHNNIVIINNLDFF